MLRPNMPSLNDKEGTRLPAEYSVVIDSHVHIFPEDIFSAIWKWFDNNAWPIRYRLDSRQIVNFLLSRGISHVVALQYAHRPGIAEELNRYMVEVCSDFGERVTGMATVFPGEKNAELIVQRAYDSGLGGLKLHVHVQCFDINSDIMAPLYACCQENEKPIILHAGREPKSSAYGCDPFILCKAEKVERVLQNFPALKLCVPHLGFDEISEYAKLLEKYDNLWLDTAMVLTNYFPIIRKIGLERYRAERIMFGSDFPNIPYAWDREINELLAAELPPETIEKITHKNSAEFFNIDLNSSAHTTP